MKRKYVRRCGIALFIMLALFFGGCWFQAAEVKKDMENLTPPGQMIEINGHLMHIHSGGKAESDYTLVLTAGSGTTSPYTDFYPLYSRFAPHMRYVVYERPGYGWSEAAGDDRSAITMAEELHELLIRSGEQAPYVLIAHSMGSLEMIAFAREYPGEVAGLVLIDGISPEYAENFRLSATMNLGWEGMRLAKNTGILRGLNRFGFMESLFVDIGDLPEEMKDIKRAMALRNINNPDMKAEMKAMSDNGRAVRQAGDLGRLPLLIFSATNNGYRNWEQTQTELKSLSSRWRQVVFPDTKHYIHHDKGEEIVKELEVFLTELKQEAAVAN